MAKTIIGLNDAKAVKRYSGLLAVDVAKKGYWSRKFFGVGETASAPVHQLNELQNDAGEQITYDLSMQLTMQPIEGDNTLEGYEEDLKTGLTVRQTLYSGGADTAALRRAKAALEAEQQRRAAGS